MPEIDRAGLDRLLAELRPKLHRYCARMTGSVIDGEDVVQEALLKALEGFERAGTVDNPQAWLFRIAHNAALDHLRRRARDAAGRSPEDMDTMVDPANPVQDRQIAATSLRTFMRLPVAQRSSVILMDVLGYSLEEIGAVTASSIPAVKANLHRGRARLRELAEEPEDRPLPVLPEAERARLASYVAHFNARDFDTIRAMLADDVQLELVNRRRLRGRSEVQNYFTNYDKATHWHFMVGLVEGRPAILVRDPKDPAGRPNYFILLDWSTDRLVGIRDFLYASYAIEGAETVVLE